ncbi:MAG: hypothetical protein RQ847_08515 [Wenzhouxiangellaceae bacterium]|nr:hypothetical protein [Wenzhouxiangellaceae bacterium]
MSRTRMPESAGTTPGDATITASATLLAAAALTASAALLLTGCGSEEPEQSESVPETSPRMIERDAPRRDEPDATPETEPAKDDFRVVPDVEGALEEEGMGLDVIIDASSKQAYAESLRWIAEDASKDQVQQLEGAIRYIHMYDPSVFGNEERMLKVIDGKTGQEVIEYATRLRNERRGG